MQFWTQDEEQIYLIGLKFYTTHAWPFFGPDVTSTIQMPGALQGLAVGLPFFVAPVPEAPYVLLNLLSFGSLCFLAWYCARRLPEIPGWIIWTWLLTAPWTLELSTHVYNPSYVTAPSVLFFVGFLEILPYTSRQLVPPRWANFMMGLAVFWVMQFHLSWIVFVPFVLAAFYFQARKQAGQVWAAGAWFALGSLVTGAFLLPTYLKLGLRVGSGDTPAAVSLDHLFHAKQWVTIPANVVIRFLAFACFDISRFLGGNTKTRLAFLHEHLWLVPLVVFLSAFGVLQGIAMVAHWFRRGHTQKDWVAIKYLALASVCLLSAMFLFSFRPPFAHTFILMLPLAMIYSLYCWSAYLSRRGWQIFAGIFLICGIIFHVGLGLHNRSHYSLYVNRGLVQSALDKKDYRILGERQRGTKY